jgi:phage terminase large subunit
VRPLGEEDREDGIQAVRARLRRAGDDRPRLFVLRDSTVERDPELDDGQKLCSTAEELAGYVWAIKSGGELREESAKDNDHGADALR